MNAILGDLEEWYVYPEGQEGVVEVRNFQDRLVENDGDI